MLYMLLIRYDSEGYQIKEIVALLAEAGFVDENRFLTLAYNAL